MKGEGRGWGESELKNDSSRVRVGVRYLKQAEKRERKTQSVLRS